MSTTASTISLHAFVLFFLINAVTAAASSNDVHWSYDVDHGPSHWCHLASENRQCCGRRQSPIDIDEFEVTMEFFKPLAFLNYSIVPSRMTMSNNGHTVQIVLGDNDTVPILTGGGMKDAYQFVNMHFHWGRDDDHGSEHTISGHRYPLEMHMVHYNTKYDDLHTASLNTDGLAVVAVFFHLAEKDNDALKEIVKVLDEVVYADEVVEIQKPFAMGRLLPPRSDDFYRYHGSLTTPPCSEVVTWTVLDSSIPVSEDQLEKFRSLRIRAKNDHYRDLEKLVDNFRPTQSLSGRRVHARSTLAKIRALTNSARAIQPVSLSTTATVAIVLLVLPFISFQ